MTRRRWLALGLLAFVTAGVCLLLLTDLLPVLRGPIWLDGEWQWPYTIRPYRRWWLPILASLLMLGVAAWWLGGRTRTKLGSALGLLALVIASVVLQAGLVYADRPSVAAEMVDRNLAVRTTGYFRLAAEIEEMGDLLRNYPAAMDQFESEHARTHPPGLVLANWLLIRALDVVPGLSGRLASWVRPLRCTDLWLLDSPNSVLAGLTISSFLAPLFAALAIPLGYFLARQMAEEAGARLATVMVATLPALLLFTPLADQILAWLGLAVLLLLFLALRYRSTLLYLAAGFLLSLATFISLGTMSMLVIIATIVVAEIRNRAEDRRATLRWAGAIVLGVASLWLGFWLIWGVTPWEIAQTAMDQHYQLVTSRRRYGIWLGFNLADLLLFSGLVVITGFAGAFIKAARQVLRGRVSAAASLCLGMTLMIGILLLSGATRGEVGRIWLFFLPLTAVSAGIYLADWIPDRRATLLMVALQLAVVVSLGVAWRPVEAVIVTDQRPAMPAVEGSLTELGTHFEQAITLIGFSMASDVVMPGSIIELSLIWKAGGPTRRPYTVFAHLVDAEGELQAQHDGWPVQGLWPPTCWQTGEAIVDPIQIPVPADLTLGDYELLVGLYDAKNYQRLKLEDGGNSIRVSTIRVASDG